jgi:NAD(P)-dependent dehydrogenase (short-subunit alcohol dehydrogenase family)
MPTALITGASKGLGRALATSLIEDGWVVIVDGRTEEVLRSAYDGIAGAVVVPGAVTDARHRDELAATVRWHGGLDLLVNNASRLGPSPQPPLAGYPLDELARVYDTNAVAPLALTQLVLPALRAAHGVLVNVSSDAAVEAYDGWGGYGSSKAALDQLTRILGAEEPDVAVYAFDPGDMRTDMHQAAFPGEDISDRPEPSTVVPSFRRLISERPGSGRYRAADLAAALEVA